jgi:hypothetical protein
MMDEHIIMYRDAPDPNPTNPSMTVAASLSLGSCMLSGPMDESRLFHRGVLCLNMMER